MSKIDRAGTFRGTITQCGIAATKAGAPQFVAKFRALEYWNTEDPENPEWMDWSPFEECEATGYFVLVSKQNHPIFHMEDLKKALGWSGSSFGELAEIGNGAKVQFRLENDTYEGKTTLKVNGIDHYDAEPGGTLRTLDADEIKKLDAKFSKVLRDFSGGPKPKPVGKPANPEKKEDAAGQPVEKKAVKKAAKKPPRAAKAEPEPMIDVSALPETATEDDAWEQMETAVAGSASDDAVQEAWLAAIETLGGADAVDEGDSWAQVRDLCIANLSS